MPPIAVAIATIAAAATSTGLGIYEATNQPGTPKPSTTPAPLTSAQNKNQAATVANQLPTLQALTGGSLSPEYAAQFGATQAGVANDPQAAGNVQSAINSYYGLTAPGASGLTPSSGGGGTDILSLLSKALPGGKPPGTAGGNNFVDQTLNGDTFKGLSG